MRRQIGLEIGYRLGLVALCRFAAEGGQKPAVLRAQPNDLVSVDVAALNDGGLQLLYAELHRGDLLHQRLFRLGEPAAEFPSVGVDERAVPHRRHRALIGARQGNTCLSAVLATFVGAVLFGGSEQHRLRSERHDGAVGLN